MEIKELEAQTGLGRDAIRYYERRGLLGFVPRGPNNYRDYPSSLVRELKLLSAMQALGFSLDEISSVLEGMRSQGIDCRGGAKLLAAKREDVERQIRELRQVSRLLRVEQARLEERARKHGRG
ncbi:MerR family transcriptional regulator [Piscinibacter gummiphilus]|uniref:MerR family transcriptional regulator n=1 Tax=Piscinibacter gummiphilus TaxID=946333 RepID=A0ABZ0CY13_9BURK|nr:MerR family transcriptional regulator [Piscinibacter gummiphilus]WOB09858.1 MerR family transcriptional regulator [Piscinibacter gummiphilus]